MLLGFFHHDFSDTLLYRLQTSGVLGIQYFNSGDQGRVTFDQIYGNSGQGANGTVIFRKIGINGKVRSI